MNHDLSWAVALGFVISMILIGGFDIYALLSQGRVPTITTNVVGWSKKFPLLPFLIGVIVGHLFFPAE